VTQEQTHSKPLIIVVDDDEDILNIFSRLLRKEGYNVHAFSNPAIAFEHYRYSPNECSLIISDVRMPKINGFQLARKVKELNPDTKVILTSAFEIKMSEFEKVLPNAQVDGFLDKPIRLEKLSEIVKAHIKSYIDNA
jgi:DNA-binding NtrC family response regulator